jgi:hypothetical protein
LGVDRVRSVHYQCVKIDTTKENYEHYHEAVDHKHCNILPKPATVEMCHGRCESTRWEYTNWSEVLLQFRCVDVALMIVVFCPVLCELRGRQPAAHGQLCRQQQPHHRRLPLRQREVHRAAVQRPEVPRVGVPRVDPVLGDVRSRLPHQALLLPRRRQDPRPVGVRLPAAARRGGGVLPAAVRRLVHRQLGRVLGELRRRPGHQAGGMPRPRRQAADSGRLLRRHPQTQRDEAVQGGRLRQGAALPAALRPQQRHHGQHDRQLRARVQVGDGRVEPVLEAVRDGRDLQEGGLQERPGRGERQVLRQDRGAGGDDRVQHATLPPVGVRRLERLRRQLRAPPPGDLPQLHGSLRRRRAVRQRDQAAGHNQVQAHRMSALLRRLLQLQALQVDGGQVEALLDDVRRRPEAQAGRLRRRQTPTGAGRPVLRPPAQAEDDHQVREVLVRLRLDHVAVVAVFGGLRQGDAAQERHLSQGLPAGGGEPAPVGLRQGAAERLLQPLREAGGVGHVHHEPLQRALRLEE